MPIVRRRPRAAPIRTIDRLPPRDLAGRQDVAISRQFTGHAAVLGSPKGKAQRRPAVAGHGFMDLDEAMARANALPVSFQSSLFTRDLAAALAAAERLDASAVMINDHTAFRTDWMPFAGRRESGLGVGGIPFTMADMTAEKMIVFRA